MLVGHLLEFSENIVGMAQANSGFFFVAVERFGNLEQQQATDMPQGTDAVESETVQLFVEQGYGAVHVAGIFR